MIGENAMSADNHAGKTRFINREVVPSCMATKELAIYRERDFIPIYGIVKWFIDTRHLDRPEYWGTNCSDNEWKDRKKLLAKGLFLTAYNIVVINAPIVISGGLEKFLN